MPAQHDHPEKAGELVYRIERRYLIVQPRLYFLEPRSLQASRGCLWVGVILVVLPAFEIVPVTLFPDRDADRPRGARDVALAATLGHEASVRLQSPGQPLEEPAVVLYPMERRCRENEIHPLLDLEHRKILTLHPHPRLPGKPPPRRLDHSPGPVYGQHRPLRQPLEQ